MTAPAMTSTYRCPDGTEFPVTWQQPEDVRTTWRWEQEHQPEPMTPLEIALGPLTRPGGIRAFAEAQVPTPALFRGGRIANGYLFTLPQEKAVLPSEEQAELYAAVERLTKCEGGVRQVWERFCLPRIESAAASLRQADIDAPFAEIGELFGFGMRMTHVAGSFSLFAPIIRDFAEFGKEIGVDGQRLFVDLTPGQDNATLEANTALWELGEIAERSPTIRKALLESSPEDAWRFVQGVPEATEFVETFQVYLERYGCRTEIWALNSKTWQEDPATPLALIRRIIADKPPTPSESQLEGKRRRETVVRDIEQRLAGDAGTLARFRKLIEPLEHYIPIREARAYWQLALTGIFRGLMLQRGQRLAARGVIREPEDVLFLVPEDIEARDERNLSPEVEERRAEWKFWAQRRPPATIGGETGTEGKAASADDGLIRGVGASRGVVTAKARVLADVSEGSRLQRGEVLVCGMSSPPWTPLFAIASAVVTDSGGILSHPAIVAREYGIPCVVGTRVATQVIRDGAMITVDGDAGTVRVEK